MHYKNGREAKEGDIVIGLTYNKTGVQVGRVVSIRTSPNPEEVKNCNVTLMMLPPQNNPHWNPSEYSQCDWLLHVEDAWSFVIGVAYSPDTQDYFAKVMNFRAKWNAPMQELQPGQQYRNEP